MDRTNKNIEKNVFFWYNFKLIGSGNVSKKIVATTSTGCLDYYESNTDIRVIRIRLNIDGTEYVDGLDMTADQFFDYIRVNRHVLPKTSQPSLGDLLEFFEGLIEEGYEEVFVTTISSKLSGTYNGICQCREILKEKINIIPFDTATVCFNEGMFALKADEMYRAGHTTDEIIQELTYMRENNTIFFVVNSLEYLVKNGRLSGAAGFLGKYMKIKPVLQVKSTGQIEAIDKIRTTNRAIYGLCEHVNEYIQGREYFAYIAYTGVVEYYETFEKALEEICGMKNLSAVKATPVVGCHVGGDIMGVGIFIKKD